MKRLDWPPRGHRISTKYGQSYHDDDDDDVDDDDDGDKDGVDEYGYSYYDEDDENPCVTRVWLSVE